MVVFLGHPNKFLVLSIFDLSWFHTGIYTLKNWGVSAIVLLHDFDKYCTLRIVVFIG